MAMSDRTMRNEGEFNLRKPPASAGVVPEPLIDSEKAAAIIGIHPKTLQKMARSGEIRGVHVGKLWRFRASSIEEWINQRLAS
jgi:excisionase family DNA binding protein